MDLFTKKLLVQKLEDATAASVANCFVRAMDSLGIPMTVATDNGSEFKDQFPSTLGCVISF